MSLRSAFFFAMIPPFPAAIMTLASTIVVQNNPAPNTDPMISSIPSSLFLVAAEMEVNTSGAPFPKASNVTPATVSGKRSTLDIFVSAGDS